MQTIQLAPGGEAMMTKKRRIYSMLFGEGEPPLIYTGSEPAGCLSAHVCHAHRLEHPHCAFFKKEMELKGMNVLRRTLYTTDNWLHTDYQIMPDGNLALLKKFIRNENDLKSMYFYLTDVSVNAIADHEPPQKGIPLYPVTMLPLEQCLEIWMGPDDYRELMLKNEQLLKKCFYHMAQITTAEAKLISESVPQDSGAVIDLGNYMLGCGDEEYVQWRTGFIKKIKKITHMPVMLRIDAAGPDTCAGLSDTCADILAVPLVSGGIGAAQVLECCGTSFAVFDIDHLDDMAPLKNIDIAGNGAYAGRDKQKLADLERILNA